MCRLSPERDNFSLTLDAKQRSCRLTRHVHGPPPSPTHERGGRGARGLQAHTWRGLAASFHAGRSRSPLPHHRHLCSRRVAAARLIFGRGGRVVLGAHLQMYVTPCHAHTPTPWASSARPTTRERRAARTCKPLERLWLSKILGDFEGHTLFWSPPAK